MSQDLKQACFEANQLLVKYNLVDLDFGNVSVIDREKARVAIKPSGMAYHKMKADDIVILDPGGQKIEGDLNPSSDTPTHLRLYEAFESINAVVHTHSRCATSFAQAGQPINCFGTTHADLFNGPIPLTQKLSELQIRGAYELETGNVIVERFLNLSPEEFPGVLVHSHGPFAWGPDPVRAVKNALMMEVLAQMALNTLQLNPNAQPIDPCLRERHFFRKHGEGAYYGQGEE